MFRTCFRILEPAALLWLCRHASFVKHHTDCQCMAVVCLRDWFKLMVLFVLSRSAEAVLLQEDASPAGSQIPLATLLVIPHPPVKRFRPDDADGDPAVTVVTADPAANESADVDVTSVDPVAGDSGADAAGAELSGTMAGSKALQAKAQ